MGRLLIPQDIGTFVSKSGLLQLSLSGSQRAQGYPWRDIFVFIFDSHHASIIWQGRSFCIIFLGGSGGDTIFVVFSGSTWSPATFGRNHIIPVIVLCIIMLQDGGHTQKGNAEEKGIKGGI